MELAEKQDGLGLAVGLVAGSTVWDITQQCGGGGDGSFLI